MGGVQIEHVAVWARDLERLRDFYVHALGGRSGPLYENPRTGFRSYFVAFDGDARIELMSRGDVASARTAADAAPGLAHVAFRVGSRGAVDAAVARLEAAGVVLISRPRTTGDGYYEAVIEDPEGNRLEIVA
jgi:lactoylglutathione lyase